MSMFLHFHEIAARRGDGLRPELLAGLKRSDTKAEFKVVAIEQKRASFEPRHSCETCKKPLVEAAYRQSEAGEARRRRSPEYRLAED